jgi:hypothetical protein
LKKWENGFSKEVSHICFSTKLFCSEQLYVLTMVDLMHYIFKDGKAAATLHDFKKIFFGLQKSKD